MLEQSQQHTAFLIVPPGKNTIAIYIFNELGFFAIRSFHAEAEQVKRAAADIFKRISIIKLQVCDHRGIACTEPGAFVDPVGAGADGNVEGFFLVYFSCGMPAHSPLREPVQCTGRVYEPCEQFAEEPFGTACTIIEN